MEKQRYITIQEWMLDYDLTQAELMAFAIVWGFSQEEESAYKGGYAYAEKWLKLQRRQTISVFNSLVKKGLIQKENYLHGNVQRIRFKVSAGGSAIIAPHAIDYTGVVQLLHRGSAIIAPKNKIENKNIKKEEKEERRKRLLSTEDSKLSLPELMEKYGQQ